MSNEITSALAAIGGAGAFATELVSTSNDLHLEVRGVGALRFPISAIMARKLCAVAAPAPFGLRDQTIHDKSVRDSGQISRQKIKIDQKSWQHTLESGLVTIQKKLGLPAEGKLEAVLDKMLVYGPGQFFAPHQDSERSDDMVGSLVVELPCVREGGALIVQHHTKKKIFRGHKRGPKDLALVAFYADCHHEVQPVKSGYRISLTYLLTFKNGPGAPAACPLIGVDRLASAIKGYFSTPIAPRYGKAEAQRPDRLIYMLDHQYTRKSLRSSQLKNSDRSRVKALADIAKALDCEIYLTLADVHESWSCDNDNWGRGYGRYGYGRRRYKYHDEDEDDIDQESDEDDYELGELLDSDIELEHWVHLDGKSAPGLSTSVTSSEVFYTRPSTDLDPFRSEHEGYMGNYGNTVDRWYHRAALVMWPRARNFVIRAKLSPSWAVEELQALVKAGHPEEAELRAKDLLPFWNLAACQETTTTFIHSLFAVSGSLSADTASQLLRPVGPHRIGGRATPLLVKLVDRHGFDWAKGLFSTWQQDRVFNLQPWLPLLPALAKEAILSAGASGKALATWLFAREVGLFKERHSKALQQPLPFSANEAIKHYLEDLVALFSTAAIIGDRANRNDLVAYLTAPDTALPPLVAADLLKTLCDGRTRAAVRDLGLEQLYRYVVYALDATLAVPPRSADDWSIAAPAGCACVLCKQLRTFLIASEHVKFEWPLAKDKRQHIHGVIDRYLLPVTHKTIHSGSPHKLVLTKQPALFVAEKARRKREFECLAWLKKQKTLFAAQPRKESLQNNIRKSS